MKTKTCAICAKEIPETEVRNPLCNDCEEEVQFHMRENSHSNKENGLNHLKIINKYQGEINGTNNRKSTTNN